MPEQTLLLTFDRGLYLAAGIDAAVEAYRDYVESIDLETTPEHIQVTLRGFDASYADIISDSFANHALFETVIQARDALGEVHG